MSTQTTESVVNKPQAPANACRPEPARQYLRPTVNITENADGYLLEAELPGVAKEGLEVSLEGAELTIVGHRAQRTSDAQLLYRETSARDYRRVFALDPEIDTARISAKIEHGILQLQLPKAEQAKPRKIAVA